MPNDIQGVKRSRTRRMSGPGSVESLRRLDAGVEKACYTGRPLTAGLCPHLFLDGQRCYLWTWLLLLTSACPGHTHRRRCAFLLYPSSL